MTVKLYKDGITVELAFESDVALYKSRGFVEASETEPAAQEATKKATQRKKAGEA